ncbi:MAG: hypothetical protein ABSF53_06900 [Terracidiphilus sp.]|jgi:hypothetical protein
MGKFDRSGVLLAGISIMETKSNLSSHIGTYLGNAKAGSTHF